MLLPAGSKLLTQNGFEPVEMFEGKSVLVSSFPYFDMAWSTYDVKAEVQEVYVERADCSSSTGTEGMPMHPTTNFLASSPYTEKVVDLADSAYFLNTMHTYGSGVPAIITKPEIVPEEWLRYRPNKPNYKEATSGTVYFSELFGKLMSGTFEGTEGANDNDGSFMLFTEISKTILFTLSKIEYSCKYVDYTNTRLYIVDNCPPDLVNALLLVGFLMKLMVVYSDNLLKVYIPTINLNKIGSTQLIDFRKAASIYRKRKVLNKELTKKFNNAKSIKDRVRSHYQKAASMMRGVWYDKVPSIITTLVDSFAKIDILPIYYRASYLQDRKSTIYSAKGCWLPPAYFENVQWYLTHSATPKLLPVQSPGGTVFYISTIGGT